MVPEVILTAIGSALAGGAYVRWRVRPDLEDLNRWRAVSSLRDDTKESIEYVAKVVASCICCGSNRGITRSTCSCSRTQSHVHAECAGCKYRWVIDPLDPNAK